MSRLPGEWFGQFRHPGRRGSTRPEQPARETSEITEWRREDAQRAALAVRRSADRLIRGDETLELL